MMMVLANLGQTSFRVVTKILSCRVNTTSGREIEQPGISFGSVFLSFSNESCQDPGTTFIVAGGNPRPQLLTTAKLFCVLGVLFTYLCFSFVTYSA